MSLGTFLAARDLRRGFEIVLAMEANPEIAAIYSANFQKFASSGANTIVARPLEDRFDGELGARRTPREANLAYGRGKIDLVVGGPPCQGNSDLNNRTRRTDARNLLYERVARAAEILRPRAVIIENVPTVVHDRNGVVDRADRALQDAGYAVAHSVLSFDRLGAPQRRRRHFLIGIKGVDVALVEGIASRLNEGTLTQPRDVQWAIGDLRGVAELAVSGRFDAPSEPSPENRDRLKWFQRNADSWILPNSERPVCHRDGSHSYKSIYGRMRWNEPAQTITTGYGSMGQGCYVHPDARRTITPHEAARLQTFPDFFDFTATSKRGVWARAIGNAVPPFAMREIVREVVAELDGVGRSE